MKIRGDFEWTIMVSGGVTGPIVRVRRRNGTDNRTVDVPSNSAAVSAQIAWLCEQLGVTMQAENVSLTDLLDAKKAAMGKADDDAAAAEEKAAKLRREVKILERAIVQLEGGGSAGRRARGAAGDGSSMAARAAAWVAEQEAPFAPKALAEALGATGAYANQIMSKLVADGRAKKTGRGEYRRAKATGSKAA